VENTDSLDKGMNPARLKGGSGGICSGTRQVKSSFQIGLRRDKGSVISRGDIDSNRL